MKADPLPRRVLMTADTVGGVFNYAVELATELSRASVRVMLATMGRALSADQRSALAAIPGLEVRESTFALEWMDDPWGEVDEAGRWLLALEREFAPELVHLNGYAHAGLGFRVPVVSVAHSCVFSWFAAVLGERPPERYTEYQRRVSRGLSAADVVVAPTQVMLGELARWYGSVPHGRVIANGVDARRFRASPKEPFFLGAGRLWDHAKNLELLCAVAPDLPWPLRLAGEGSEREGEGNLSILGRLSHGALAQLMARAAVFVHPARYEPFGLSPLEAAISGCALILGDVPSLREVWSDAACYVDPDDSRALLDAAQRLAAHRAEREHLARSARRRAEAYSSERMARAYLGLYAELRKRKRSAA